jgi:hypothetical protein
MSQRSCGLARPVRAEEPGHLSRLSGEAQPVHILAVSWLAAVTLTALALAAPSALAWQASGDPAAGRHRPHPAAARAPAPPALPVRITRIAIALAIITIPAGITALPLAIAACRIIART